MVAFGPLSGAAEEELGVLGSYDAPGPLSRNLEARTEAEQICSSP